MPAFKRSEWNDLVGEVNDKLTNPTGSSCPAQLALNELPANSIWKRTDVTTMRERIMATCPDIVFESLKPLWDQATLDEIRSKLDQMWCNCTDDCVPTETSGLYASVYYLVLEPLVLPNTVDIEDYRIDFDVATLLLGPPGFPNYSWTNQRLTVPPGEEIDDDSPDWSNGLSGFVGCDGRATAVNQILAIYPPMFFYFPGSGSSQAAAEANAAAYGVDAYRIQVYYGPLSCPNGCA